jgi:V/A-type H+-transporting ATPase subunit I
MRVDLKKFLFFGPEKQKSEFFRKAQSVGAIEFIDHSGQKFDIVPEPVKLMKDALKILRGLPSRRQSTFENVKEAHNIAGEVVARGEKKEMLEEELRFVDQEMERVAVFGSFSQNDLDFIRLKGRRHVQFFFAKHKKKIPNDSHLLYVGKDHNLHYFISISHEKKSYEGMIEMVVTESYDDLLRRRKEIFTEIHQHEHRLKELVAFRTLIKQAAVHEFNSYYLQVNVNFVEHHWEETLFSIEGWISINRIKEVEDLLDSFSIYMTEVKQDENEVMPTHLENEGTNRVGEDLVYIYDTPANSDKDPSGWVLWAFAFFFAFIVGDGGYGFVFLALFFIIRWKAKEPSPTLKRFNKLIGILAVSTIIWGTMVSSFFGIEFDLHSPLKKHSPVTKVVETKLRYHMNQNDETYREYIEKMPHLENFKIPYELLTHATVENDGKTKYVIYDAFVDNFMLELALFIGVIHLITSMLRDLRRNWSGIGWILFLVGSYLYFPEVLGATSLIHYGFGITPVFGKIVGPYLLFGGIILAVGIAIVRKHLAGATEI